MIRYAGVDLGTGGVRAVVVDTELEIAYRLSREYEVESPESGWAQQDPDEIVAATLNVLEEISDRFRDDEVVFSFSSVMHSLIAVDREGDPVSPMLIWADNRAICETKWLEQEYGAKLFYRSTACPLHPSFWPGKIIWLTRELDTSRIARYVSIKEYFFFQLTGRWIVDISVAGSSGLFSLREGRFDPELLEAVRITEDVLSEPVPSDHTLRADIAGRDRELVVGSTDGVLANLGIGAVEATTMVLTVGSSAAVRLTSREPVFDEAGRAWCYSLDDRHFVVGEASNSGGLVLNWFAEILGFESAGAMTDDLLPNTPYEPVDALLLPTLSGERAPGYQEELRGELIDLALSTSRSDLVTSAVEGVALFCRFIFDDVVRAVGSKPERTILTGSLGRARPIAQLAPVLLGATEEREEIEQSSAIGAAVLAIAAHTGDDIDEVVSALPPFDSVESNATPEFAAYLDRKYERFADAYRVASRRIKAVEPAGPR